MAYIYAQRKLVRTKDMGTYIMNGTRLAKKNDLAMKVMVAFAIAKIVVLIINHKTQEGFVPLLVLFALFAVGNVVFQLINDRSELMKFTSVTAFSVLVLVSVFVSGSVMEHFRSLSRWACVSSIWIRSISV